MEVVTKPIRKLLLDIVSPKKTSNASDRNHHQINFKEALRNRYRCKHATNPNVTRCMVLGDFLSTDVVIASHIIGLTNRLSLSALNLNPDNDIWSERNGLLVYKDIESKYESQDIVSCAASFKSFLTNALSPQTFLYNHVTHAITIQVLYDDVMDAKVRGLSKNLIGVSGVDGNTALLYSDIDGRQLQIPPLVFPYRRALYFVSKTAYGHAMSSSRAHRCAASSNPSEDTWEKMLTAVKENSVDFDTSSVGTA